MRFFIFITVALGVLTLGSGYIAYFMVRSGWFDNHRRVIWLAAALFIAFQLLGPILYRAYPDSAHRFFIFHWITYMALGVFASLVFYIGFADIVQLISKLTGSQAADPERRNFLLVGAATLGSLAVGTAQALTGPKVYEVDIPLKNLPAEFEGFKIAQISDLHVGPLIGRGYVENVVDIANKLAPDLVALTGDFVDGSVEQLSSSLEPIKSLKSAHGSFFITGNHEYYWGVDEWLEYHRTHARVLLNEHVVLKKGNSEIVLAGVTDLRGGSFDKAHASDAAKALEGAPSDAVKIMLAHQPASYPDVHKAGAHLQLSGHTHGGQFFPWSIVVKFAQHFYKGLNRHENLWVYVNRGTGYWGPPLRFTVPAEITLIRLRKA